MLLSYTSYVWRAGKNNFIIKFCDLKVGENFLKNLLLLRSGNRTFSDIGR